MDAFILIRIIIALVSFLFAFSAYKKKDIHTQLWWSITLILILMH